MSEPIIAVDADGVLLNYSLAYAGAWEKAFGVRPKERDPLAYWPVDRWDVPILAGEPLQQLREAFDETFWANLPPITGAVQACQMLVDAGFKLVCLTAMPKRFREARQASLQKAGFPIDWAITTEDMPGPQVEALKPPANPNAPLCPRKPEAEDDCALPPSPKAQAVERIGAVALVDDYLPYLQGLPPTVHAALVMRGLRGSPNRGRGLAAVNTWHSSMAAFAHWWLANEDWRRICAPNAGWPHD